MVQNTLLQGFMQINTLPVGIVIYMIIMIVMNRSYEPEITRRFRLPVFLLLALIIDDNIDYYLFNIQDAGIAHVISALVGYNLRIVLMLSMLRIVMRNNRAVNKLVVVLPAVLCFALSIPALFTHLMFWYSEVDGSICRGPLAYLPHLTGFLYMVLLVKEGIQTIRREKHEEGLLIIVGCAINFIGVMMEMLFALRGILMGTIAMIIVFYYLYIHTEYFKVDILTGAFNRISFRADGDKYSGKIKGLVMIDLNNLKKLNDSFGHEEGDRALKTLAFRVNRCLPKGCYLYRTGGDEFAVICTDSADIDLQDLKTAVKKEMGYTKYTWAAGCAEFETPDEEFSKVFRRADEDMYKDKAIMKGEVAQ